MKERIAQFFEVKTSTLVLLDQTGGEISDANITSSNLLFFSPKHYLKIPSGPNPKPFVGNLPDIMPQLAQSLYRLAPQYGEMFKIVLPRIEFTIICNPELVEELFAHPDVFQKQVIGVLTELRNDVTGQGLFTSFDGEEIWEVAHRILLPAFSQTNINKYVAHFSESTISFSPY